VTGALTDGLVNGVEYTVLGSGGPVTLFAHGLGGGRSETRPLAGRVGGTRVLLSFRGHGGSDALTDGWDYDVLADDVRTVADHVGATGCVGLSLGGGALLRVLRDEPDRFERLAFVLPAALDSTRGDGATERLRSLGHAIDRGDADEATALLMAEVPAALRERRGVELLLRRRAADLVTRPAPVPRGEDRPLSDRSVLGRITAPTLVVGQDADPLHPIALARELSSLLPNASLLELPEGGVFWTDAARVQAALADHLETS
jgi:pimeloyl-ACP methyl ester carboxylesterase